MVQIAKTIAAAMLLFAILVTTATIDQQTQFEVQEAVPNILENSLQISTQASITANKRLLALGGKYNESESNSSNSTESESVYKQWTKDRKAIHKEQKTLDQLLGVKEQLYSEQEVLLSLLSSQEQSHSGRKQKGRKQKGRKHKERDESSYSDQLLQIFSKYASESSDSQETSSSSYHRNDVKWDSDNFLPSSSSSSDSRFKINYQSSSSSSESSSDKHRHSGKHRREDSTIEEALSQAHSQKYKLDRIIDQKQARLGRRNKKVPTSWGTVRHEKNSDLSTIISQFNSVISIAEKEGYSRDSESSSTVDWHPKPQSKSQSDSSVIPSSYESEDSSDSSRQYRAIRQFEKLRGKRGGRHYN